MSKRCRRKSDHPMWSVLKNASFPDWTEGKTVVEVATVLGSFETIRQVGMRIFGKWGNKEADE